MTWTIEQAAASLRSCLEGAQTHASNGGENWKPLTPNNNLQEREAEAQRGMFPSYRSQLSFAAHVLVTMFTFFALGYWGGKQYLELDELWVSGAWENLPCLLVAMDEVPC